MLGHLSNYEIISLSGHQSPSNRIIGYVFSYISYFNSVCNFHSLNIYLPVFILFQ